MTDYYTPKQIADKLSINIYTLLKFVKNGDLESINVGSEKSPTYRISSESFNKFLELRSKKNEG